MAINPLALAGIVGAAGQGISAIGDLVPTATERSQAAELKRLKRLQEMSALGLTDAESAAIAAKLSTASTAANQAAAVERSRLLAGSGQVQSGAQLAQAVQSDAASAATADAIGAATLQADLAKQEAQREKLAALEAAASATKAKRLAAIGGIVGAGLEGALLTAADQKIIQGAKAPSPQLVASIKSSYGFATDDEARGWIEFAAMDPKGAELMSELMLKKRKADLAGSLPAAPAAPAAATSTGEK